MEALSRRMWRPAETRDGVSCSSVTSPLLSPSFPILGPNEWRQLGSPAWCCALLGGIDSWIIPQAAAADYQQRSHQGLPHSPPPLQLLFNLSIASSCPLRCPPVTPRQERDAFPEPAARVLLTGNLNSNNYGHYWCHKQVGDPKPGREQRLSNPACKAG